MRFFEEVCVAVYRKIRRRNCFREITVAQFKRLLSDIAEQVADRKLEHFNECYPVLVGFGQEAYPHESFLNAFSGNDADLLHQSPYWKDIMSRYYRKRISFRAARAFANVFVRAMVTV